MNHAERRRRNPPKRQGDFVAVSPNNRSKRARRKIRWAILKDSFPSGHRGREFRKAHGY